MQFTRVQTLSWEQEQARGGIDATKVEICSKDSEDSSFHPLNFGHKGRYLLKCEFAYGIRWEV